MTTAVIVQARMGSTRLPGKVMRPLGGEPVIRHVLRKCLQVSETVVCAVPDKPESAPIEEEATALGCAVVRGPEHDVLARYHMAALRSRAFVIARVTADCPLIDPDVCKAVIELVGQGASYASNVFPRTYPKGLDCEAFTFALLDRAHRMAETPYDREHVTPWMQRTPGIKRASLPGPGPGENFCLDTAEDYERLSAAWAA